MRTIALFHPLERAGAHPYCIETVFADQGLRVLSYFTDTVPLPRREIWDSQTGEDVSDVPF